MHSESASLQALPDEILEAVLVTCAENGHAETVAAIAATSRRLHSTIYRPTDHHLWRSLLLALFDDPRTLCYHAGANFNWREVLQSRLWAPRFILRHGPSTVSVDNMPQLRSKMSIITYSVGAPRDSPEEMAHVRALHTIVLAIHSAAPDPRRGARPLGAIEQARSTSRHLVQLHAQSPQWPPDMPPGLPSLNVAWLKGVLANGLPAVLTAKISLDNTEDDWYAETSAGRETGRVVSHLGFIPIPSMISDAARFSIHVHLPTTRAANNQLYPPKMDENSQRTRALWHARGHVFNLGYLSPRRNWGPYLAVLPNYASPDSSGEDDDPDWQPYGGWRADVPPEEKLLPDWSWLGAARVVAECTLRAHKSMDDITKLEAWDNLREGAWFPPARGEAETQPDEPAGEDNIAEHDWAGVEGVWRRLVCWLGYADLIGHNELGMFATSYLEESWVIVPVSLRITGYSPSPIPAYPNRPTIHVEGEMGGAGWEGDVNLADEDIRRVHGTVSVLADGSVRWFITSGCLRLSSSVGSDRRWV